MTFMEAVEAMKEGKAVQRPNWDPNRALRLDPDDIWINKIELYDLEECWSLTHSFTVNDIEATDWQVAEYPPYCRCQNTLLALRDVYQHVTDIDELSEAEALAMRRIVKLCKRIAEDFQGEESL